MCGIAGILGRLDEPNRVALRRMNAAIAHRGPDSDGFWESTCDARGTGALFAFRRLAILDLSPAGSQPMVDPVTGHVVVFNGEIYNYVSLREELVAKGQAFSSSGDTAVMLRALGLRGHAALGTLRGMFAFALWDPAQRRLTLARDPLGIKPLYYARNPDPSGSWSLIFASELRALLASGLLGSPRLHARAAASIVWNGFMVAPETAIAGIECVMPGEVVVADPGGGVSRELYASLPAPAPAVNGGEAGFAQALEESVRLHLASDVPLGVFLSGGVDSSAIANLACKVSRSPVHTFTLSFQEREHDEGPVARRVAAALGTQHQEVILTEHDFISRLDRALDSLDQPTFDGLNSYYMSHAVREAGFTVALAGTGGDELFGGYTSFRDLPALLRWSERAEMLPAGAVQLAARAIAAWKQPSRGAVPQQTRWAKLPDMATRGNDLLHLYQLSYALFLPDFQRSLLGDRGQAVSDGLPDALRERLRAETAGLPPLESISVLEQRVFLGERLLRDTDAASMAASIEIRVPLVDVEVARAAYRLPGPLRYQPVGSKPLLRRLGLSGLDPALFNRPKAGFVLPFDRWLRAGLGKVIDETMSDPKQVRAVGLDAGTVAALWRAYQAGAPGIYWTRIWAIYVFIRWCHRHRAFA